MWQRASHVGHMVLFCIYGHFLVYLRRVDLPLVGLERRLSQHALEHPPVLKERCAREVRHQVHVHLEACVLETADGCRRLQKKKTRQDGSVTMGGGGEGGGVAGWGVGDSKGLIVTLCSQPL